MPRHPARENTARNVRNRLMVDHSPPRDMRKRKFQKLDRISGANDRDFLRNRNLTAVSAPLPSPSTPTDSAVNATPYHGEDDHDIQGSLPVKTKVFCLFRSCHPSITTCNIRHKMTIIENIFDLEKASIVSSWLATPHHQS